MPGALELLIDGGGEIHHDAALREYAAVVLLDAPHRAGGQHDDSSRVRRSMDSFSRSRKPASPSFSKMNAMSTPVRASMSRRCHEKLNRSMRARCRPRGLARTHGPMRKCCLCCAYGILYGLARFKAGKSATFSQHSRNCAPVNEKPPRGGFLGSRGSFRISTDSSLRGGFSA